MTITTTTDAPIRVLIVDDEPLARRGVRLLLEEDPEVEIVGECAHGDAAVDAIQRLAPDLLFLDVQMPGMDGFQVLRALPPDALPSAVVLVTAYDRYALQAFDAHALDYILKPWDDERFRVALRRAKARIQGERLGDLGRRLAALLEEVGHRGRTAAAPPPTPPAPEAARPRPTRLAVRERGRVVFLPVEEIDWIEAADYYVRLHVGSRTHLLRESMRALERTLDPGRFFRVHRSAIVNLERVKELQPWFHGQYLVVLEDGTQLKLSRRRRERLQAILGSRI